MTTFISLGTYNRTVILLALLVLQLISFTVLAFSLNQSGRYKIVFGAGLIMLLCHCSLVFLITALNELDMGQEYHPISEFFIKLPVSVYLIFILLGTAIVTFIINKERQYQYNIVTKGSIKEFVDNLPAGLCFVTKKGIVLLANHCMENLCHTLTGYDLQNGIAFWNELEKGELKEGASRISGAENPIILLADKRTWSFTRRIIEVDGSPIMQITAIDTTKLGDLWMRLEKDNEELAEIDVRLRCYSKNIKELKAKEERLAAKIRIHDEIGYALLSTRYLLQRNPPDIEKGSGTKNTLFLWKHIIAMLKGNAITEKMMTPESLVDIAKAIGIKLYIQGNPPEDIKVYNLILQVAGECLTNAVRHGRATELYLDISETDYEHIAVLSNNGRVPTEAIIEGGGLSVLRQKVEDVRGTMIVSNFPKFNLAIKVPKEGDD